MSYFFTILLTTVEVTAPIFILLICGKVLSRLGFVDDHFVGMGSRLVFYLTLPVLLFVNITSTNVFESTNPQILFVGLLATVLVWGFLEVIARLVGVAQADRGIFVQGSFRSNLAIVGLAYCFNAYGGAGLAAASLYLAGVTALFNLLSVVSLNSSLDGGRGIQKTLLDMLKNPLLIAIALALPASAMGVQIPRALDVTATYLANMTLPLALLCTGASLSFLALRQERYKVFWATFAKLVVTPFVSIGLAYHFDLRGMDLGIIALMSSAPTAAASYIMVRAMGGNAPLAANIIAVTSLASFVTTTCIFAALELLSWV